MSEKELNRKDEASALLGGDYPEQEYVLYTSRFLMLGLYGLIGCMNNAIWVAYSSISTSAAETYDYSEDTINYLAATYLASSVLFIPLGSWLCDVQGVRVVVVICSVLNMIGAWIRYGAGAIDDPHTKFWIVFVGQCICAMAQPLFLPAPPKIAANWFGEDERTLATGIGSLAVVAGIGVGYALSIWLVGPDDHCCSTLNLVLAILITVPCIGGIILFRDNPPTPPTPSSMAVRDDFFASIKGILKKVPFILLLLTISPGYGLVTALFSLVGELAEGKGYDESTSGVMGVVLVFAGLLGAVVFGAILDETKKYILLIKVGFLCSEISVIGLILAMQFELAKWLVLLMAGISGFCLLALLPMCIELGVEVCYPAPEGTVTGALMLTGTLFGLVFFFVMQILLVEDEDSDGVSSVTDSSASLWFMLGATTFVCFGSLFIHGDYLRLEFEEQEKERNAFNKKLGGHSGIQSAYHED